MDVRSLVTREAASLGFSAVRFAAVQPTPTIDRFDDWLAQGFHADMAWLPRGRDLRANPARRGGVRTAVALALRHHHARPPDPGGRTGLVARYAWGRDYHNLLGKKLEKLKAAVRAVGIDCWGGVDTAPILERAWANTAGLGFTGKNTVQYWPGSTSWMLLGVLFLAEEVAPDAPITKDHCGTCARCLVGCPTGAFVGPRVLDANKCISYWTIEARGLAPRELRGRFGRWLFGCDACQEVCPHNHHPPDGDHDNLRPRHAFLDCDALLAAPDDALLTRFTGTPLRRPGAAGLKRNAAIVLGNLGDDGAVDALRTHGLTHPAPVVRAASVWALGRLGDGTAGAWRDPDPLVAEEVAALTRA